MLEALGNIANHKSTTLARIYSQINGSFRVSRMLDFLVLSILALMALLVLRRGLQRWIDGAYKK
jgi:hypothetical protein